MDVEGDLKPFELSMKFFGKYEEPYVWMKLVACIKCLRPKLFIYIFYLFGYPGCITT